MTQKLQGYGQPQDWDDETYYPVGQSVADRGGIWRALVQNRNSRPISGNTDWTLVAGTPYVMVQANGAVLNTLFSSPLQVLAAPGAGKILMPGPQNFSRFLTGTRGYPQSFLQFRWIGASDYIFSLNTDINVLEDAIFPTMSIGVNPSIIDPAAVNAGIEMFTSADFAGSAGIDSALVTLNAGGAGYSALDEVNVDAGDGQATIRIDTVDGGGAVLTFHLTRSGSGYSVAANVGTLNGGGTGFTVDIGAVGNGNGSISTPLYYNIVPVIP